MKKWIEIYFDAENVSEPLLIGTIKRGLWKVVIWDLDKNHEPIIDSGVVLLEKGSLNQCQEFAELIATDLRSHDQRVVVSGNNPGSRFPVMPAWYETMVYQKA